MPLIFMSMGLGILNLVLLVFLLIQFPKVTQTLGAICRELSEIKSRMESGEAETKETGKDEFFE